MEALPRLSFTSAEGRQTGKTLWPPAGIRARELGLDHGEAWPALKPRSIHNARLASVWA
jgi:hypothetical protein